MSLVRRALFSVQFARSGPRGLQMCLKSGVQNDLKNIKNPFLAHFWIKIIKIDLFGGVQTMDLTELTKLGLYSRP